MKASPSQPKVHETIPESKVTDEQSVEGTPNPAPAAQQDDKSEPDVRSAKALEETADKEVANIMAEVTETPAH